MTNLLVLDGTALLFRAYFGGHGYSAPDGTEVGGVMVALNLALRLLRGHEPRHVAMVFDAGQRTFRNDLDPLYKANRGAPPDDLKPQFSLLHDACRALGFATFMVPGFEADDIMATLARRCREESIACHLIADDKDLFQLVSDQAPSVTVESPRSGLVHGEAEVHEKLGVRANQVVDYQALVGDGVDNVPGVRGVGAKTAVALLKHFDTLEALYANLDLVAEVPVRGARTLGAKLSAGWEDAKRSRELVFLRSDVPIEVAEAQLAAHTRWWGPEDNAEELFEKLGFYRSLRAAERLALSVPAK